MNPFGSDGAGGTRNSKRKRKPTPKMCVCCSTTSPSSSKDHRHQGPLQLVHDTNSREKFACQKCGKVLLSRQSLKRHLSMVHADKRDFVCKFCPSAYKSRENLVRHLKGAHSTSHEDAREISFELGGVTSQPVAAVSPPTPKKMKRSALLVKRARAYQPTSSRRKKAKNGKVHKCPECGAAFPTRKMCGDHLGSHKDVRPFSCRYCVWIFKRKDALFHHLQKKHGKTERFARKLCYGAIVKNSYDMRDRNPHVVVEEKVVVPIKAIVSPVPPGKPPVDSRAIHVIVGGLKFSTPRIVLQPCDRAPVVSRPKQGCDTFKQWFWKDYCNFVDEMNFAPLIKTEPEYEMTLIEMAELLLK